MNKMERENQSSSRQEHRSELLTDVMAALPSQEEIDEQIDKYAFVVPYDGSNDFYDEAALRHYRAGIEWIIGRILK